jgi:hypothetical protein
MAKRTTIILNTVHVLFWIIFIGLCIKTGTLLFGYFISMAINSVPSGNLYMGLSLSAVYQYGLVPYTIIVFMLLMITGLKAYIGYWVLRIFKELTLEKPFSAAINQIIIRISKIALWTGLLAIAGHAFSEWLLTKDIEVPIDWAYGEILFFAAVIYIIAEVFRKGIELQSEIDLTV